MSVFFTADEQKRAEIARDEEANSPRVLLSQWMEGAQRLLQDGPAEIFRTIRAMEQEDPMKAFHVYWYLVGLMDGDGVEVTKLRS